MFVTVVDNQLLFCVVRIEVEDVAVLLQDVDRLADVEDGNILKLI